MGNVIDLFTGNDLDSDIIEDQIIGFWNCEKCLAEIPPDRSAQDFAKLNVGFTKIGIQVWCVRHDCNVMYIDFNDLIGGGR